MPSTTPARPAPKKRRHLIDFDNPPPAAPPKVAEERLTSVQQWVMSVLIVTTALHLSGGLVVAALAIDGHLASRIGLVVIAAIVGVIGMACGLLVHRRSPLHWLLVLGLLPAAIGSIWIF